MLPRIINEYVTYPGQKETLYPVIFKKFGRLTETESF